MYPQRPRPSTNQLHVDLATGDANSSEQPSPKRQQAGWLRYCGSAEAHFANHNPWIASGLEELHIHAVAHNIYRERIAARIGIHVIGREWEPQLS